MKFIIIFWETRMTVLRTLDPALLFRLTRQETWSRKAKTPKVAVSKGSNRIYAGQDASRGAPELGHLPEKEVVSA